MATLQQGSPWWVLSDDAEPGLQARVLVEDGLAGTVQVCVAGTFVVTLGAPAIPEGGTVQASKLPSSPGPAAMSVALDTEGGPPRRRTVILVPPDLLVVVDDVESVEPVRWRFHLDSAQPPGLGLHARRLDFANGSGAVRLYQLAPAGTRLRAEPGPPRRAVVETTQPTRTTRFVTVLTAFRAGAPPPVPERLATDKQVGLVHASTAGPRKLLVNLRESSRSDVTVCAAPDGGQVTVS